VFLIAVFDTDAGTLAVIANANNKLATLLDDLVLPAGIVKIVRKNQHVEFFEETGAGRGKSGHKFRHKIPNLETEGACWKIRWRGEVRGGTADHLGEAAVFRPAIRNRQHRIGRR